MKRHVGPASRTAPLLPDRPVRRSAFAVALGLHGSDASFRFLLEFAALSFVVLAAMHGRDVWQIGIDTQRFVVGGSAASSTEPKVQRDALLSRAVSGLNLPTVAAPRPQQYPLTPNVVASAPPERAARLSEAMGAYIRHEPAAAILDGIRDLEPDEPNTGLVRGLLTIALGGKSNAESGMAQLHLAGEQGLATTQALYGLSRLNPPAFIEKDHSEGRRWLELASRSGDAGAKFLLGYAYLSGWAGISDPGRGADNIRQAAEGGHVEAMKMMATLHLSGQGVPKDMEACERYLRMAMASGDTDAQGLFGAYLLSSNLAGWGSSLEEAAFWLRKAADAGNPNAMHMLGMLHVSYAKEPPLRDLRTGVDWFERCTRVRPALGSCAFALGHALETGQGREADTALAAMHYRAAGELHVRRGAEAYERLKPGLSEAELQRAAASMPKTPVSSNIDYNLSGSMDAMTGKNAGENLPRFSDQMRFGNTN